MPDDLPMWVIYDHPKDFPDCFVARKHVVVGGLPPGISMSGATPETLTADTLAALREKLPPGLTCLTRDLGDDPVILETWL